MPTEKLHTDAPSAVRIWSILRLISLLGIILALIAVPSLAWMAHHRAVKQNTQMGVEGEAVIANRFQAYKFGDEGDIAEVFGEDLCLPIFDSVFLDQNVDKTIVLRAPVFGSSITAGSPFTIYLNLRDMSEFTGQNDNNYRNGTKAGANADAVADYLSNVVTVKCAVITGGNMQSDSASAEEIYTTAHEHFKTVTERKTFVVNNGDALFDHKDASITFDIEGYTGTSGILFVYLEMGYDSALVNTLVKSRNLTVYAGESSASGGESGVARNIIQVKSDLDKFLLAAREQ